MQNTLSFEGQSFGYLFKIPRQGSSLYCNIIIVYICDLHCNQQRLCCHWTDWFLVLGAWCCYFSILHASVQISIRCRNKFLLLNGTCLGLTYFQVDMFKMFQSRIMQRTWNNLQITFVMPTIVIFQALSCYIYC